MVKSVTFGVCSVKQVSVFGRKRACRRVADLWLVHCLLTNMVSRHANPLTLWCGAPQSVPVNRALKSLNSFGSFVETISNSFNLMQPLVNSVLTLTSQLGAWSLVHQRVTSMDSSSHLAQIAWHLESALRQVQSFGQSS